MTDADEIERLRKLLSDTNTYYAECIAEREELRAENEKLRAALKQIADNYNNPRASKDGLAFLAAAALKGQNES